MDIVKGKRFYMKERVELCLIKNTNIKSIERILSKDIGSVYISVNLDTISFTRDFLIKRNFTTRLCVFLSDMIEDDICSGKSSYYIFGKKKGNKGVFNEKCKNTVFRKDDNWNYILDVSSNNGDLVLIDDDSFLRNKDRKWRFLNG